MRSQRARIAFVLFLAISLAFAPYSASARSISWNMFGFNASHTFATDEQISTDLSVDWMYDTGGGVVATATPCYESGRFYVPQASGMISCYNEETGKRLWRSKLSSAPIVSKPKPVGGYLVTTSYDGKLYSLFAKDGSTYRSRDIGSHTSTSPVVSNGYIFTVTDEGELAKWTINGVFKVQQKNIESQVKLDTDPVVTRKGIAIATNDDKIKCFDIRWGKNLELKWERSIAIPSGSNSMTETADGILTVDSDGILHYLNWDNGKDIWALPLGEEVLSGIITDSGNAYLATMSGNVHSISISGGRSDWMRSLKEEVVSSNLSISGGKLYVGSKRPARHLHCLTLTSSSLWNEWFEMPFGCNISAGQNGVLVIPTSGQGQYLSLSTSDTIWKCDVGGLSESAPVVDGNQVFFTLTDGSVRSINSDNGRLIWRKDFETQINSSPAIGNGKIVLAPSNKPVVCLDSKNGRELWQTNLYKYVGSAPTIYGNTVFVGAWDGLVYSYDLQTGNPERQYKTYGQITSSPTITRDGVFVGSHDRFFYKFHRINGNNEWLYPTGKVKRTCAESNRNGFVISENTITSLDMKKSHVSLNWSRKFDSLVIAEPAYSQTHLFVMTADGYVTCIDQNEDNGETYVWKKKLSLDGSYKSIILCRDRLCILTGKSIYILSAETGKELWNYKRGINITGMVLSNGKLIISTQSGSIVCMSPTQNVNVQKPDKLPSAEYTLDPKSKEDVINEAIQNKTTPDQIMVW